MTQEMAVKTENHSLKAAEILNHHFLDMVKLHFSEKSGCPFWLDWKKNAGWDPLKEIKSIDDLPLFPHFNDEWLRDEVNEKWVPQKYKGRPFCVFETGGTTGMPKQRISWEDHLQDYTEFSETLDDKAFPKGGHWLMLGPTGPRRLRLTIEHLANIRGGSCFFVDMDPRWVKQLIAYQEVKQANAYKEHAIQQAVTILRHRKIQCLFTTPKLLESLAEKVSIPGSGIKGVFCGGTTMTPQYVRFIIEEVLENKTVFVPTYGNTLMGLACHKNLEPSENFSVTYYAPQPRAVLRIVDPDNTSNNVPYGSAGRVELSTFTQEFFMPRFLERDEAVRRKPCSQYPWDGVGDVRPFGQTGKKIVEGVY